MGDAYYKPLGLPEITTAVSTPEAGIARLFVKPGGLLYVKTSDAIEHLLALDSRLIEEIQSVQDQIDQIESVINPFSALIIISDNYQASLSYKFIICTASNKTVTLPTAINNTAKEFIVKNIASQKITLNCQSGQTIDGESFQTIDRKEAISVVSDGSNWIIF